MQLPSQVGFSYFAEWWRKNEAIKEEREREKNGGRKRDDRIKGDREVREDREKERGKIQVAYDTYKIELQAKSARTFVHIHKNEEWFKEHYVPEVRDPIKQRMHMFRRINFGVWDQDLQGGVFDEFTLEGIHKSESNGAGGLVEKEEGEASAANETLGVGDLLPMKGGDLRDETIFQPTLLIKTIAPTVSRDKLEDLCREKLGEGEGGFKWLSMSDPNPSKRFHRIGWVMLQPDGDAPATRDSEDIDLDTPDEGIKKEEDDSASAAKRTAERALEAINGQSVIDKERGDFTCHVGVHAPPREPKKKALWDLFSAPERIEKDLELAMRLAMKLEMDLGPDYNGLEKINERVDDLRIQGLFQPTANGKAKKEQQSDFDTAMEEEEDGELEEDEGVVEEEQDDEDLLYKKKKLDLLVEYFRRVFNFCFFCVFESDSAHELTRKCPGGHLRRPRPSLTTAAKEIARASAAGEAFPATTKPIKSDEPNEDGEISDNEPKVETARYPRGGQSKADQQLQRAFNWVRTFEDKLMQILEPENVDLKKLGGKDVDEAVEDEFKAYVKEEDVNKWRCKVPDCSKLFKAEPFWRKHVEKRHPEWYEQLRQDVRTSNSSCLFTKRC
jgi:SERRATE/Ars2, N-terminal domain/Domain of unknown function (DUF4187)/Arsenite-resistance protein 2